MQTVINRFGDIIINSDSFAVLDAYEYDPTKSISVKTLLKLNEFHDFELVHTIDTMNIYANVTARSKCPAIIDGKLTSSVVIIVVNNGGIILVKDRMKLSLTSPGGSRIAASESFESCGIREVFEETGIELTEDSKLDRKSTRLNSSHYSRSRMPSSA